MATTIQTAEKAPPSATISVLKKCIFGLTRSQPKTSTARNPDSRKKAKIPSAASAEPKTSPTKREYAAQFVPNSNSMTIPVATPSAKLSANRRVQNRAAASHTGFFVRRNIPSRITMTTPSPMVRGGNR